MRRILLLLVLVLSFKSYGQDLSDSLRKYSYLIQAKTPGSKLQATGFFVRYGPQLFFVTAAHCLTGWDPFRFQRVENSPDTFFIRMTNDTAKLHYLTLPVADIKQAAKPFREYETPDVYVLEIRNPKAYPVYSIEKYFKGQVRCETARDVWVFGYPRPEYDNEYLADRQQPLSLNAFLGEAYCLYAFRPEAKRPDELNYFTTLKHDNTQTGLSGAPAYLLTDDKQIVFGGVYIGGPERGLRTGMVVRPEYVVQKIMSQIRR